MVALARQQICAADRCAVGVGGDAEQLVMCQPIAALLQRTQLSLHVIG